MSNDNQASLYERLGGVYGLRPSDWRVFIEI